ncbi:MAG: diguanylate cyclase domain-containing protein [Acidimicrobiales bacterium]
MERLRPLQLVRLRPPIVLGFIAGTAFVAYLLAAPGSARSVTAVSNVVQTLVPLCIAAPMAAVAAVRSTGRGRMAWALLAAGCTSWGLGQVVWTWFEVVKNEEVPYPGLADIGFLGSVPFLLAGVLVFPSSSLRSMGRARAVIDGGITLTATLFASYGTFLGVIYRSGAGEDAGLARVLGVVYPSADLLILAVVLAVVARRANRLEGPLPWIGVGVAFLAIADVAFAYLTAIDNYAQDPVSDAGWPIGFGCIALAAWTVGRAAAVDGSEVAMRGRTTLGMLLPYVPVVPAVVVFSTRAVTDRPFGLFLGITGSVLVLLFFVRQVVTLLENQDLTTHLRETVAALRRREGELQFQAFHDPLTALANRALFRDRLEHALSPRRPEPVSVLFIDLDDFKLVNDTMGHDAGDHLLVLMAERLRACVRSGDTVARLGGDEFAVLLEGDRAANDGGHLADRILAALDIPFVVQEQELRVTASVGLACGSYESAEEVLKDADLAMYAAKDGGKGRVAAFQPGMREVVTNPSLGSEVPLGSAAQRSQHRVGQLRATDEQVGKPRVAAVVDER